MSAVATPGNMHRLQEPQQQRSTENEIAMDGDARMHPGENLSPAKEPA